MPVRMCSPTHQGCRSPSGQAKSYGLGARVRAIAKSKPFDFLLWCTHIIVVTILALVGLGLWMVGVEAMVICFTCMVLYSLLWVMLVLHFEYVKRKKGSSRPGNVAGGVALSLFAVVWEFFSYILLYVFIQPWDRLARRFTEPSSTRTRPADSDNAANSPRSATLPILLIHGFFCNSAFWLPMRFYLYCRGVRNIYSITLSPPMGDIQDFSASLAVKVEAILQETGAEKLIIVAHSMGGLVARHYIQECSSKHSVAKLICLGTPHHGSEITRGFAAKMLKFVPCICLQQMNPASPFLQCLTDRKALEDGVPIVNIFSYDDEVIVPQESSILSSNYARSIPCNGIGHMSMPFSPLINSLTYNECMDVLVKQ